MNEGFMWQGHVYRPEDHVREQFYHEAYFPALLPTHLAAQTSEFYTFLPNLVFLQKLSFKIIF